MTAGLWACCGPPRTLDDGQRAHVRRKRKGAQNGSHASPMPVHQDQPHSPSALHYVEAGGTMVVQTSIALSDGDFMSCRDDFSVTDGSHLGDIYMSLPTTPRVSANLLPHLMSSGGHAQLQQHVQGSPQHPQQWQQPINQARSSEGNATQGEGFQELQPEGISETDSELEPTGGHHSGKKVGFSGCLHLLDNLTSSDKKHEGGIPSRQAAGSRRHGEKPAAGCSMMARDKSKGVAELTGCWEDARHSVFQIRREDYLKSKIKQPSQPALYQLACADIFAFPKKQHHIAKLVQLPHVGPPVMAGDVALPPLLIFNLQLPLYPAPIFGPYDGEGVSIVFYFRLPDDFDPARFENQAALELFKRFLTNSREEDGTLTRDRLKLIPRVVNVEEWARKGPLSQAEHKLLSSYNDKPILSRPQHAFYQGRGYFEVDLDLHQYTYLARRAIGSFLDRLPQVIWENAFVVQGNAPGELPEHLLGVARVYRYDFRQAPPLPVTRHNTGDGHAVETPRNVSSNA